MTADTRDGIARIGVVGAGTMGTGIAQCLAQHDFRVVVVETDPAALARARDELHRQLRLAKLLGRGAAVTDPAATAARVTWVSEIAALADIDCVIESVPERPDLKAAVFADLDRHCPPGAVLATGTSAIPVARLAARVSRPDRVVGLHFMNPAPLTAAVEVVRGPATSERTLVTAVGLVEALGKQPVVVGDGPGFVLNRLLMQSIAAAAERAGADDCDAATVDAVFERCLGHPMGPLRTADLIGLDNVADTLEVLRAETGDERYTVPAALADLVAAGRLGRKTGRGFHDYH
ncbi:3-hydroxyacyl-CoA dehydrogenase family protein [Nocardia blacklockiae]|uniref:3-hydroxyacyl-CoA dehydrogenase family protein n=1 Tax=Nocardia blacklockiae TaxID=480036 RepID=UPI001895C75B|nr:3-hydroxyacyl-CoA dehydrogenase family protein [Nocardia blacklockiae]MBF6175771.1 3-hydroxyacyl-CoA dehydrogenase family protein [Nocardia blacklockiae]